MRKWLLIMLSIFVLLVPVLGRAQGSVQLSSLTVNLWPEYDSPKMLVIYDFYLPAGTPLPVEVNFRIPLSVGQAFGFGYYPEDGSSIPIQENYGQRVDGGWLIVSFTMRSLHGTVEYYDPALTASNGLHRFEYLWPGDYAVDELVISLQQPTSAQNVQLSTPANRTVVGKSGLLHHEVDVGKLLEGATYSLVIDYEKSSSSLSVENMGVEPAAPIPQNSSTPWWLPWGFAVAGITLIVGGISWYMISLRRTKPGGKPRRHRRAVEEGEATPPAEDGVYCHQCGRRASVGDRFCRACGTQLRLE